MDNEVAMRVINRVSTFNSSRHSLLLVERVHGAKGVEGQALDVLHRDVFPAVLFARVQQRTIAG